MACTNSTFELARHTATSSQSPCLALDALVYICLENFIRESVLLRADDVSTYPVAS